jgi:3-hydroxyacyl-CoA dehydrogenase
MTDTIASTHLVTTAFRDGVAVIEIDNPPVNALGPGVPERLVEAVGDAEASDAVLAIVIRGAGRTFMAGADIHTLEDAAWGHEEAAPDMHALLQRLEDCRKPIVMAIHGTALGGGLELAMAGHYRVASAAALVGQPEVNLGIIPGAEGTQRLPRLAGVEKALDLCVSGRPIGAAAALAAGILDAVTDDDLTAFAIGFARDVSGRGPHPRTRARSDRLGTPAANAPLYAAARAQAAKIRRRQTAPLRAIEAIEAAATLPFDEGRRREREIFFECVRGEQAKALIHLFFAERAVSKVPGVPKDAAAPPVQSVGIIGAGTMGAGIAAACANAGLTVRLMDESPASLDTALAGIRRNYETSMTRGRLTADAMHDRIARIAPQASLDGFEAVDLVIEAVFEDLALKQRLFREVDARAKPGTLLASNTSTHDLDAIAAATSRPADVVGLHFFSPAQVMRLVEIVRGRETGGDALARALAFTKRLGKIGVVVGNGPGFVGNRMMFPYMYETQFLAEEGATPEQVDGALTGFGMAMGMFAVDDLGGIDVAWRVRQSVPAFRDAGGRPPLVQNRLFELGRLGQKTGRGWYRYEDGRTPIPDPDVIDLIRRTAAEAGIPQRTFTNEEIVERSIYALVNEGARILDEGLVRRAADIDVIYANGYGFPGWRGGPMFYADRVGLRTVLDRIRAFERDCGPRWAPAPLLERLAAGGRTFRDFDRTRSEP